MGNSRTRLDKYRGYQPSSRQPNKVTTQLQEAQQSHDQLQVAPTRSQLVPRNTQGSRPLSSSQKKVTTESSSQQEVMIESISQQEVTAQSGQPIGGHNLLKNNNNNSLDKQKGQRPNKIRLQQQHQVPNPRRKKRSNTKPQTSSKGATTNPREVICQISSLLLSKHT